MAAIAEATSIFYQCGICCKEYHSEEKAAKFCGSYELEATKFSLGQRVTAALEVHCGSCGNWYIPTGKVLEIFVPTIGHFVDRDGKRDRSTWGHVYQYGIECRCPKCGHERESPSFWTSELVPSPC